MDPIAAFRYQAALSPELGSPLNGELCRIVATDLENGGPSRAVLGDWPTDARRDGLPLRLLGCLHRLVLDGSAPTLARHYPTAGGTPDPAFLAHDVLDVIGSHREQLRAGLESPSQINEVRRSCALALGFARLAPLGLPLHTLEIGASAGLLSLWDRYHFTLGDRQLGPENATVRLHATVEGTLPPLALPTVVERQACDLRPIDLRDPEAVLRVRSYVWPDQPERLRTLDTAIAAALEIGPVPVDRAPAGAWLEQHLPPRPGRCTVVFHSIVWPYLPDAEQEGVTALLSERGSEATDDAPLVWLRMEDLTDRPERDVALQVTRWPGGTREILASCHPHGSRLQLPAPSGR